MHGLVGPRGRTLQKSTNGESLLALLNWFLPDGGIFAHLKFHGNTRWSPLWSGVAGPMLGVVGISQSDRCIHASRGMLPSDLGIVTAEQLPRLHGGDGSMDFPIHRSALVALASEDGRDRRQILANRRLGPDRL